VDDQDFYWNFNKGEKTSAQKIWKGYFRAPLGYTKPPKNQEKAPHIKVSIDWVHGYRGSKCRNNLRYLNDGSICYHVAALAVIYDP
jgi:microtubule-associated protein-like 6